MPRAPVVPFASGMAVSVRADYDRRWPPDLQPKPYTGTVRTASPDASYLLVEDAAGDVTWEPAVACQCIEEDPVVVAPCPACGKPMVIGDETEEERCCDACASRTPTHQEPVPVDPNANLKEQLEVANLLRGLQDQEDADPLTVSELAFRLADLVLALDKWMTGEGYLPTRWDW